MIYCMHWLGSACVLSLCAYISVVFTLKCLSNIYVIYANKAIPLCFHYFLSVCLSLFLPPSSLSLLCLSFFVSLFLCLSLSLSLSFSFYVSLSLSLSFGSSLYLTLSQNISVPIFLYYLVYICFCFSLFLSQLLVYNCKSLYLSFFLFV